MYIAILIFITLAIVQISNSATYYVATTGSDSNSCSTAQNINTPKRNLMGSNGAIACMTANADILYVREGTYTELITNLNGQDFPAATSWANARTVSAYNEETVTLTQGFRFGDCCGNPATPQMSYWIFDGFNLNSTDPDNNGLIYHGDHVDHIRYINIDITNNGATNATSPGDFSDTLANTTGNCIQGDGSFLEFINITVHDCGAYGIYYWGADSLFDNITVHDVYGYGIHLYHEGANDVERNTVRNSLFYNVMPAIPTGQYTGAGILIARGTQGSQAYNNVIRDSGGGFLVGYNGGGYKVFNNTVVNNSGESITVQFASNGTVTVSNNILYNNGTNQITDWGCGGGAAPCGGIVGTAQTNLIGTNPQFVSIGTDDLHLTTSSPAKDAGTDLSAQGFSTDFDGVSRPQGSGWDIGAYEFVQADTTDPVVTITAPTSNTTYSTATTPITTIAGTATDAVGTTGITWANAATSGSGSGSGCSGETSCNWSVSSISLNEGSNAITITGTDAASNEGTDTITVTLDTTPPSRNNGAPSGTLDAGTTSTSISLNTNETATCKYGSSAGVAYGSLPNTFSSTNSTSHSTTVSGLSDGNSYTYYVRCQDALSNANTSDFSISFSVDEEAVVTINPPSSLNTTHSSTVTVLSPPSTLNTTNTGSITVLGSPSSLNQTGGSTPVFLGQPLNLNNL